jgi:hypothetical protein
MSEEYENEVEELGEELTPEELFEQHRQEIAERFEEKGFFRRLLDMFSGLSKPKSSREYKIARVELQRLAAPLLAVLLPTLGVIVLIVITAVTGQTKEVLQIEVARAQEEQEELTEEQEPEPEIEPETPPDEMIDVQVDTPSINPVSDMSAPTPAPSNEPVSVKPAAQDSVAIIKSPVTMKSMAGSRNPGMIGKFTSGGAGYGDANTEATVLKCLWWLKAKQDKDGGWTCGGSNPSRLANAAFAVLAFLAHGETPASKNFGETVEKAMQFLIESQYTEKDGTVRFKGCDGNEYAFLVATYALCETYGMTKNPNTKTAAMKALGRIINTQSPTGGWDYKMNKTSTRDDLSYAGWALQALKAGKMAGMHPDGLEECIKKGIKCLKTRNWDKGSFTYCANARHHRGLTATGCLAMQLLGYGDQPEVKQSLDYMKDWTPAFDGKEMKTATPGDCPSPQYYCYYAAQCKYQAGMRQGASSSEQKNWQDWNAAMKKLYPSSIKTLPNKVVGPDGKEHAQGYFENKDAWSSRPVMDTCLAALQLMVYYRYLPTTQTKAGAVEKEDTSKKSKKDEVEVDVDI